MQSHIISFSGGQTSGYMLRRLMDEAGADFDKKYAVVFNNTGREYDETLDFVNDVATNWGIKITWLEYCRVMGQHSFKVVDYDTAARRHDRGPFDEMLDWTPGLPNSRVRSCSGELKVRTTKRYLQSLDMDEWHTYVGIRSDEAHRTIEIIAACPKYITPHFPLVDAKITKADVDGWWDKQPFKLNLPNHKGNCDLCFLKARWKRLAIIREDPAAAKWWIDWEKKKAAKGVTGDGARWMAGKSYEGLLAEAQHPEFDFSEQDVPCSCQVGGYRDETGNA